MKENLRRYARLGLVYHLLYSKCTEDPEYHEKTLFEFLKKYDIETFDCCIPNSEERRKRLISAIINSGKEVVYANHMFPMKKISPSSTDPPEQGFIHVVIQDQVQIARAIGSTGFIISSGPDVPKDKRPKARKVFADFCRWLCLRLRKFKIVGMLEPMDRKVDKKCLYGPTTECVELINLLAPEVDNLGIVLDFAHLPLMNESFSEAVKVTAPYLKRVHLGNCVLKDTSHPFYGDKHPPIGIEGGEIDTTEVAEILSLLLESGYLNKKKRGPLVLEIQPFPGKTPEETVVDNMERVYEAWKIV